MTWVHVVNAVVAAATLVFAGLALVRPGALTGSAVPDSGRYFARMYASRAVPLGLAVLVAALVPAPPAALGPLLLVAGAAQVGDAAIGLSRRTWGMVAGGGIVAAVHLASALHLLAG